jgi:hypothetical protein
MAILTTKTGQRFTGISTGVACVVTAMKVFDLTQIVVQVGDTTEIAVKDTDYTITLAGDGNGCTVTPLAPLTARTTSIIVLRQTPSTADYALTINGKFSEARLSEQIDRQIMRHQENSEALTRAIKLPFGETEFKMPAAADRENTVLGFGADGSPQLAVLAGTETALYFATRAEAEGGTNETAIMNPLRVRQAVNKLLQPEVSLYSFLPAGTDLGAITDWSTYLNAAAASGKRVMLPDHDLPYSAKIVGFLRVGGGFIGCGYDTKLVPTFDGEHIEIGDDVDGFIGHVFRDFRIWPSVAQTGTKASFRGRRVTQIGIKSVWMGSLEDYGAAGGHRIRIGFAFDRFAEVVMEGVAQVITALDGVRMHGGADGLFGAEFLITSRYRFLYCDAAIHIGGGCGGIYVGSIDTSLCGIGVNITKALAAIANREVFLGPETVLDVSTNYNLNVEGSAVYRVMLCGTWIASCNNAAAALIRSAPMTDSLKPIIHMVGGRLFNSQGDAAQLSGCVFIMKGVEVADNGLAVGGGSGIRAVNAAVELDITGNRFRGTGNATKGYAVEAVSGVTGRVMDNDFDTSGQAHISNASSSLEVRRNKGWVTEARGQAQINGSAVSVTFAHGMNVTPIVQITPRTIIGASGAAYWRVTADATNITVEANTTLNPTPWVFNWSAEAP